MTIWISAGVLLLFFIVPFLVGNIYSVMFRKKEIGLSGLYFSGMTIVYAGLFVLQLGIVKFKFDFGDAVKVYHIYFIALSLLGVAAFVWKFFKEKNLRWDVEWKKSAWWIYGLIVLQGVLYIFLKNPYFENNALLETTRVTLDTGTVYRYNAYSKLPAVAGFPLANKLMFLPMLYAYISDVFGVDVSILFNYILPVVTFVSFYLVMLLWVQKLSKEHKITKEKLLLSIVLIVQLGDTWMHFTSFRILHEGYSGEAIFFGVLMAYALHEIKNKRYLIAIAGVCAFPGLIKYSAVIDFFKGFAGYWKEASSYGGILLIYILAIAVYVGKNKKADVCLLNLNLTIGIWSCELWNKIMEKENNPKRKAVNGVMLLGCLLLCGNITVLSDATTWRTNSYGVGEEEFEVLEMLSKENSDRQVRVIACDEVTRHICRTGGNVMPVVGYDVSGQNAVWYSYETYDEEHMALWNCVEYPSENTESELMRLKEIIPVDYVVLKRVTEKLPIADNEEIKCVFESSSYLVYSVDKK